MFTLTISRRAAVGMAALCTATLATACGGSADLTTPTVPPVSTAASTLPDTTSPTTIPSTTVAPTTAAPSTAAPTTASPATPAPTAATSAPAAATDVTLAPVQDQQAAIQYDHPQLGPVTITIAYPPRTDENLINPTVRATVNATGEVVFEQTDEGAYYTYGFAGTELFQNITNPVDGLGHVFFEWDTGRYPGVSYLVPTETGFSANGSADDLAAQVHYVAAVVDFDGDGTYDIDQGFEVCTTSCADGYYYTYTWTWDGSDYTGSDVDPGPDAGPDLIRFPGTSPEDA